MFITRPSTVVDLSLIKQNYWEFKIYTQVLFFITIQNVTGLVTYILIRDMIVDRWIFKS